MNVADKKGCCKYRFICKNVNKKCKYKEPQKQIECDNLKKR